MKISRSCVTISHLHPRFDFSQTVLGISLCILKVHISYAIQVKDLKVKILDLSRLATLNFARLTMHDL